MPAKEERRKRPRPRDAASLVLVRRDLGEPRVLMGRRASRHDFMPGVHVFPGGGVEAGDPSAAATTELRPAVARQLETLWPARRGRALAVAALRETFEETGLALGDLHDGRLRPALHHVDYIGRAITPARSPKRFHARFFLADAVHLRGTLAGSGELLELSWYGIEEALSLNIIDVTAYVLEEVIRRLAAPRAKPRFPFIHYRAPRKVDSDAEAIRCVRADPTPETTQHASSPLRRRRRSSRAGRA